MRRNTAAVRRASVSERPTHSISATTRRRSTKLSFTTGVAANSCACAAGISSSRSSRRGSPVGPHLQTEPRTRPVWMSDATERGAVCPAMMVKSCGASQNSSARTILPTAASPSTTSRSKPAVPKASSGAAAAAWGLAGATVVPPSAGRSTSVSSRGSSSSSPPESAFSSITSARAPTTP